MSKKTKMAATATPPPTAPAESKTTAPTGMEFVPGAPRRPKLNLSQAMLWIHGPPKCGKTTFVNGMPGVWFIATEKGHDWITTREPTLIDSWDAFMDLMAKIDEHRPTHFNDGVKIETLCIDVVDLLFRMCTDSVSASLGVTDPGELTHGKGWSRLSAEFTRVMTKVRRLPYGLVCISHSRDRALNMGAGQKTRIEPDIGAAGMRIIGGMADLILYCRTESFPILDSKGAITGAIEERPMMRCHPSSNICAGGRMARLLPAELPLEFAALVESFEDASKEEDR